MASVHKHPKSDYWQANIKAWDEKRGWIRSAKSTGVPLTQPKSQAQAVADKYEEAALAMGPDNPDRHNRDFYEKIIRELCIAAGVQSEKPAISWDEWRRRWESEQRDLSERSRQSYGVAIDLIEKHARMKDRAMPTLTRRKVKAFLKWLHESSGLSERTIKARWTTIKRFLKQAHAEGYLGWNPNDLEE